MSLNINPFDSLPVTLIGHIFSFLGYEGLLNCSKVDRQFHKFSNDQSLWQALFPEVKVPQGHRIQDYIVLSEEHLIKNVAQFVKRIQVGQTGKITFHVNDKSKLTVISPYNSKMLLINIMSFLEEPMPIPIEKNMFIAKNILTIRVDPKSFIYGTRNGFVEGKMIDGNTCEPTLQKIDRVLETRTAELLKQKLQNICNVSKDKKFPK